MKWRNWYQNEVDEKMKGVNSRDKVKYRSTARTLNGDEVMKVRRLSSCENFVGK